MRCALLQLIYLPAPNVNIERHCAPVMCMVSSDIPLSNSGILKVPLNGKKQWVRSLGPHNQTPDHIPGGFPDTSAMPSEEDVQKMCEEGGANLVRFLMGKALTTHEPQYKSIRNWSYKDIARLPKLSRNSGDLLAKKSSTCCKSTKSLS